MPDRGKQRSQIAKKGILPEGPPDAIQSTQGLVDEPCMLFRLGLLNSPSDALGAMQRRKVQTRLYTPLSREFPPERSFAVENQAIHDRWETYLAKRKPADSRSPQGVLRTVRRDQWSDRIDRDTSVHIIDQSTGRSGGFVLRNVVSPELSQLLEAGHQVAMCNARIGRNVRRDDPGSMVQHAYTAAKGNAVTDDAFGWARNITRTTHSEHVLTQHIHDLTSWHALWWSIIIRLAPPDMVNEFRTEMEGLPRSNWNIKEKPTAANISIVVDGQKYEFSPKYVELGPASGVTAVDYARYTHREGGGLVFSVTTKRVGESDQGGNFYFAKYGILVENDTGTLIVHRSSDFHGTTLHDRDPEAPAGTGPLIQTGFSLFVNPRLRSAWKKYLERRIPDLGVSDDESD